MKFDELISQIIFGRIGDEPAEEGTPDRSGNAVGIASWIRFFLVKTNRQFDRLLTDGGTLAARSTPSVQEGDVLVAVPAFNEASNITSVVAEAQRHADSVLVVDDGSDDRTAVRALDGGADVIRYEENRGYGATLRTIFEEAATQGADHLVVVDGDGQHDARDIRKLVAAQRQHGAEIVVGNRFAGESSVPWYRRVGLEVINVLVWLALTLLGAGFRVRDTQSGFRAYDRWAIDSLARDDRLTCGMGASVDVLIHACRRGYDVRETATTISYDGDTSTHNPVLHGLVIVLHLIRRVIA